MTACVRFSGREDIVACEDMSRGGLRFVSRKFYPEGSHVEVAVPYTKDSTNIFSPVWIAHCQKLPDGRFRCGAAYIKAGKSAAWDR